jgi:hypothetical protein
MTLFLNVIYDCIYFLSLNFENDFSFVKKIFALTKKCLKSLGAQMNDISVYLVFGSLLKPLE